MSTVTCTKCGAINIQDCTCIEKYTYTQKSVESPQDETKEFYETCIENRNIIIRKLKKLTEWQPIETAPKDGTMIDLLCSGTRIADCYYEDCKITNKTWHYCYFDWEQETVFCSNPTHWMPLPKPPEETHK